MEKKKKQSKETKQFSLQHALSEAERCLLCYDAPCSNGCPAGTDPGKFIRQLRFRNIKGAIRTIRKNNILGGICAEVCPTCKLCVEKCSRTGIDSPIKINQIQSFLTNHQAEMKFKVFETSEIKKTGKKIAVIGSGPSGLSCAASLALKGHEAVIFEKNEEPGGVMFYGIPNVRLSDETINNDIKEVISLGVKIKCKSHISGKDAINELLKSGYDAIFISGGLCESGLLKVDGANLSGNYSWSEFLSLSNQAKTRNKAAKIAEGKNVAIIGGGSVAIDAAVSAKKLGANRVYVISLEALNELPAGSEEVELANQNHIIFKPQCRVTQIAGGKSVCCLKGCETEWVKKGDYTPMNARDVKNTEFSIKVDAVIHSIGARIDSEMIDTLHGAGIKLGENKKVLTGGNYQTNIKSIFAGGDIIAAKRPINTVAGSVYDGKAAADAIDTFLTSNKKAGIKNGKK